MLEENKEENYQDLDNVGAEKAQEQYSSQSTTAPLSMGQKIAAGALIVFAFLAIIMWIFQFQRGLNSSFIYDDNSDNGEQVVLQQEDSETSLRSKDTDGDNLSDWDELYFYRTSPYLEDSDSDGFSDGDEVDSGNDPNCPIGRDCSGFNAVDDLNNSESQKTNNGILGNSLIGVGQEQDINKLLESILSGGGEASALRQMLLDSGFSQDILGQISDEDLLNAYQETLKQQQ